MGLAETANVHRPQIHRRFAGGDPFRQRAAGAAGGGNSKGVEARADVKIFQLRRFAENEITIGRERFRPINQLLHAGGLQGRHAADGEFHNGFKVIPIVVQQLKFEAVGDALFGPGNGIRLVAAHHQAADFFFVISQPIGIAQRR